MRIGTYSKWSGVVVVSLLVPLLAGCGGGANPPGPITTTTTRPPGPGPTTTTTTRPPTPTPTTSLSAGCSKSQECAVSDDDMVYRITDARRFTDPEGESDVAIGFTITNKSKQGHDFGSDFGF